VVRFIALPFATDPLAVDGRLRILLVSATPADQDALAVEQEVAAITAAMASLAEQVELVQLPNAAKVDLFRAAGDGCHVVHFMVHGRLDDAGEGELMLQGPDGRSDPLSAGELRQLAHDWALGGTRLIVFNACETGRDRRGQAFSGVAPAVVQAGIPAVVSMQYPISDVAAGVFSNELYRGLAQGCPVDQAVTVARKLVQLTVKDGEEWLTPVLHMRATDGVLFEGRASSVPRLGLEADVPAQRTLAATVRRAAAPAASTQDLVVRVQPSHVRVESSLGTAEGPIGSLEPIAIAYEEALRGLSVTPDMLKTLGADLYAALFAGEIGTLLNRTLSASSAAISMRIVVDDDHAGLPWEALYHPRKRTFLALGGARRPMRLEPLDADPAAPEPISGPVRLLFVGCRPLDMQPLELEREWNWLQAAVREAPEQITMDVLMDPSPAEWMAKLSAGEYHVLHFAGYDTYAFSEFTMDEGIILLGERGERKYVVLDDLVQLLQGVPSLRLAVFNTCFTARALAPALVRCGIPSVIAWRGFNLDAVAIRFTSVLYGLLVANGWRVDAALAEARRVLYHHPEPYAPAPWHGPALYTAIEGQDFLGRG
jgi:CHAT domain-containing protein